MTTPQRIQLSRAKGWRKPENTVVVARPSKWGNPWKIDSKGHCATCSCDDGPHAVIHDVDRSSLGTFDSKSKQEQVRDLVAGGASINQAAIAAGVSWPTANRYLSKELQSPGKGGRQNEIGSYAETHGYKAAMQHFGCSKAHALNCRKKVRDGVHPTTVWKQNQRGSAA